MRYASIDVLRTLAIVMMVVVHFTENLSAWYAAPGTGGLPETLFWRPTGLAAPLFTFLVGVSYRLWVRGREARGDTDEAITKSSVRRGLCLIGLGFAFNVFVWLPEDVFNWDVLTFIGAAILVLAAFRRAPLPVHLIAAVMAVVVSPALRDVSDYRAYWTAGYYDPAFTLRDVVLGFLCLGYFPVFPWIAYPLVGFAIAPAVFHRSGHSPEPWPTRLGAALVAVTVTSLVARSSVVPPAWLRLQGWTMFPASTEYVCGTLGLSLLLLALARRVCDGGALPPWLGRVPSTFSRHALTIYLLHHVVHVWPLWLWGVATADDVTVHWQRAMPAAAALGLAAVFLLGAYALLRWMDESGRQGVEGWMRWLCD